MIGAEAVPENVRTPIAEYYPQRIPIVSFGVDLDRPNQNPLKLNYYKVPAGSSPTTLSLYVPRLIFCSLMLRSLGRCAES